MRIAVLAAIVTVCSCPTIAEAQDTCPLAANKRADSAKEIEEKVVLKPEASSELLNFGGSREVKSFFIILTASRPLPGGFTGKQLELDSPKRFSRVGITSDSSALRMPRFSHPQIIEHRRKIRFRVCVDTAGAAAGIYTGQIDVSGPPGLTSTIVTATINVKVSSHAFSIYIVLVLVAAFLLLLFKVAKEDKKEKKEWKKSIRRSVTDPTFVVSTTVALGAAFFAMHGIYDKDPAWGADKWASILALGGAAFAAAGVGSLISAFTPGSSPTAEQSSKPDPSDTDAALIPSKGSGCRGACKRKWRSCWARWHRGEAAAPSADKD